MLNSPEKILEKISESCAQDVNCARRFKAQELLMAGKYTEAKQVLCEDPMIRDAYNIHGTPCTLNTK